MPDNTTYYSDADTESTTSTSSVYSQESEELFYDDDDIQTILDYEEMNDSDTTRMVNGKYYIGCCSYDVQCNILLFVRKIHLNTFFQFSGDAISEYLYWYSVMYLGRKPKIEIMQLVKLPDRTYTAVVKTFWIRIIQRVWKKTYRELQKYISYRKRLTVMRKLEIGVRIRPSPPGLRGMLASYN